VSPPPATLQSSTRPIPPELAELLRSLKPGDKIRIRQKVRINCRRAWDTADIVGTFRGVNYLATGIATDRVPEDDIVVVTVHFTKENGELSSVTLDGSSHIERT
jgi:hypothetical protein